MGFFKTFADGFRAESAKQAEKARKVYPASCTPTETAPVAATVGSSATEGVATATALVAELQALTDLAMAVERMKSEQLAAMARASEKATVQVVGVVVPTTTETATAPAVVVEPVATPVVTVVAPVVTETVATPVVTVVAPVVTETATVAPVVAVVATPVAAEKAPQHPLKKSKTATATPAKAVTPPAAKAPAGKTKPKKRR